MSNKVMGMILRERIEHFTQTTQRIYEHYSGFSIAFVPKVGFNRKFVSIALPVGSNLLSFYTPNGSAKSLPEGTAHFMEHCVFKQNHDFNFDDEMARYGISANAYTTNDHTLYFFSCVDNIEKGIELFLDALLYPDLSAERIEKERPIILSELEMYQDDVASFCYEQLLHNMYVNHPVRHDIVGSEASLKKITHSDLALLHENFYQPANMKISIIGEVDEEAIIRQVLDILGPKLQSNGKNKALSVKTSEPSNVKRKISKHKMQIGTSYFCLGIKNPEVNMRSTLDGRDLVGYEIGMSLLFNLLIGESSAVYNELLAEGLIDESFFNEFRVNNDYAYWMCGGYTKDPELVQKKLYQALCAQIRERSLDKEAFDLKVKAETGEFLMALDRISTSGYKMAELMLNNLDLFDELSLYQTLKLDDLWEKSQFVLNENLQTGSIVEPL